MTREDSTPGSSQPAANTPQTGAHKWRRRILKFIAGLLCLTIALIVIAPSLMSTGIAREMFLDWANKRLPDGTLQIRGWSIGWTEGVYVEGLSLLDARGSHLLDVGQVRTDLTLWNILVKDFNLGSVRVSSVDFDARLDKSGQLNLLQAVKLPDSLPPFRGMIQISNAGGTLNDARFGDSWIFDSIEGIVGVGSGGPPIRDGLVIRARLGNRRLGRLTLTGNFAPVDGGAKQAIGFSDLDAAALSPLFSRHNQGVELAGELGGSIDLTYDTSGIRAASVSMHLKNPVISGPELNGDTVSYPLMQGLLNISQSATGTHVGSAVMASGTIRPDTISVSADIPPNSGVELETTIGKLVDRALNHESHISASFPDGATITANVDAPKLIQQLHNTAQKRLAAMRDSR